MNEEYLRGFFDACEECLKAVKHYGRIEIIPGHDGEFDEKVSRASDEIRAIKERKDRQNDAR